MAWRGRWSEVSHTPGAASSSGTRDAAPGDDSGFGVDPNTMTQPEAGGALFDYLVSMKLGNRPMTAKAACAVAFLATKAGAVGGCTELAVNPQATGGRFSDHFGTVTGVQELMQSRLLDTIRIPSYDPAVVGPRAWRTYAANLVFDALAPGISAETNFKAKLKRSCEELGPLYADNSAAGPGRVPLALYQDGVSFMWDRKDGALGFWFINLVTQRRHLALVLRKRFMCHCGCSS